MSHSALFLTFIYEGSAFAARPSPRRRFEHHETHHRQTTGKRKAQLMRGRLVFPFLAELCRLDTQATAGVDPDGEGPLAGGYDPDFREPALADGDSDGLGHSVRREHAAVRLPCQVEAKAIDELQMAAAGNSPDSTIELLFHFRDLERQGLVDEQTGRALIHAGDRLAALYDTAGSVVLTVPNPPGLFVREARPLGFGLGRARPQRNLLLATCEDRRQTARRYA